MILTTLLPRRWLPTILAFSLVLPTMGFFECSNSGVDDPVISGVTITSCPQWFSYLQSIGTNLAVFCSQMSNYQKCCTSCQAYACMDIGYGPECVTQALRGQCTATVASSSIYTKYCAQSCGTCASRANTACTGVECMNGGTCNVNANGIAVCLCPTLYTGSTCQTFLGSCSIITCFNGGTCQVSSAGVTFCVCTAAYTGSTCLTAIAVCSLTCLNGGTCVLTNGISFCTCPIGFSGTTCAISTTGCSLVTCFNGGTCQLSATGAPFCVCTTGYSGSTCQTVSGSCNLVTCFNGGTCQVSTTGTTSCTCRPGYTGATCQNVTALCTSTCLNGGTCVLTNGVSSCSCPTGYSGTNCQAFLGGCGSSPCLNGGACVSFAAPSLSYSCACVGFWTGLHCETFLDYDITNPCTTTTTTTRPTIITRTTTTTKAVTTTTTTTTTTRIFTTTKPITTTTTTTTTASTPNRLLTSWLMTTGFGYNNYISDVFSVFASGNTALVSSNSIPKYNIGPWPGSTHLPEAQVTTFQFSLTPSVKTVPKTRATQGPVGLWINGVYIYNSDDGQTYQNNGIWRRNAVFFEGPVVDACNGHPDAFGRYHHHMNPICLYNALDSTRHSPLLGFIFDSYPIYGPFGYSNPMSASSPIQRLMPSYVRRNIQLRNSLANGTLLSTALSGPPVNATYPIGAFLEDFVYSPGAGQLDEFNMRFSVTPEYPAGTYVYVVGTDILGMPAYPYTIGDRYFGAVNMANIDDAFRIAKKKKK